MKDVSLQPATSWCLSLPAPACPCLHLRYLHGHPPIRAGGWSCWPMGGSEMGRGGACWRAEPAEGRDRDPQVATGTPQCPPSPHTWVPQTPGHLCRFQPCSPLATSPSTGPTVAAWLVGRSGPCQRSPPATRAIPLGPSFPRRSTATLPSRALEAGGCDPSFLRPVPCDSPALISRGLAISVIRNLCDGTGS